VSRPFGVAEPDRRTFLRFLALGGLGLAAACSDGEVSTVLTPTPSRATGTTKGAPPQAKPSWRRIGARGPSARRDHSLTLVPEIEGDGLYVFGGRAGSESLGDLWRFDIGRARWRRIDAAAPQARFGHNAVVLDGGLVIFGGQGSATTFFNDVWKYDPTSETWSEMNPDGGVPVARYGAGATVINTKMIVTHGFSAQGRFDDTWAFRGPAPGSGPRWTDQTPGGRHPIKRCLHRIAFLPQIDRVLLFGGQTDGTPFLGDTWLYADGSAGWKELSGRAPAARNLYAMAASQREVYLFGGNAAGGPRNDVWRFDGDRWREVEVAGSKPAARGGVEGALVGTTDGVSLYVFAGNDGSDDLSDLWELRIPA